MLVSDSSKMLMEFCPGLVKQFPVAAAKPLAKARRELGLKVMQPAARDLIGEQAKWEWDSQEQLQPEPPAQRLAQPALVFSAPVRQQLIPLRDQLGYEQRLCSCRSNCKS
jgi:hypothetical protein